MNAKSLPAPGPSTSPRSEAAPLAAPLFRAALRCTPASARVWFASLRHRGLAADVERYTAAAESAAIIAGELAGAASVGPGTGADAVPGWAVRTAPGAREAVASLAVEDGAALELALTLPPSWPLRPAAVTVRRAVGVADARLRRWMLAIAACLRAQNGGLAGGVRLWRANVAKEFAGLEECLICYAIVAAGAEGGGGGAAPQGLPHMWQALPRGLPVQVVPVQRQGGGVPALPGGVGGVESGLRERESVRRLHHCLISTRCPSPRALSFFLRVTTAPRPAKAPRSSPAKAQRAQTLARGTGRRKQKETHPFSTSIEKKGNTTKYVARRLRVQPLGRPGPDGGGAGRLLRVPRPGPVPVGG